MPSAIKTSFKKFLSVGYKPMVEKYLQQERNYSFEGIKIKVMPGVFHPGLFFSTKILLEYFKKIDLKGKKFLELGAGTGLISIYAARKGANVTATDISEIAIENCRSNFQLHNYTITLLHSDLFGKIPGQQFDFIIINPPYYRGKVELEKDLAWYSGEQLDYFKKLFSQIKDYRHESSKAVMILSDDCEMEEIKKIAFENRIGLKAVFSKRNMLETNTIYELTFAKE